MNLLKLSKKKMFGASAEKVAQAYGQISLFNEAEQERTVLTPEPKIEEVVIPEHTRKKKRSYDEIYKDLPVEEVVYDIPEEAKIAASAENLLHSSNMKQDVKLR